VIEDDHDFGKFLSPTLRSRRAAGRETVLAIGAH